MSLWDVHVPDHDEQALGAVCRYLEDQGCDLLILGGDFLELGSMSQHGGDPRPPSLKEDIANGRHVLRRLRMAIGEDTEMHYLGGNHETRHERKVVARLPELAGFNSIPDALNLLDIGCGWTPYKQMFRPTLPGGTKGRLYYTHGQWANKHHANKHLDVYGVNVRYGHTHKPQVFTRGYADGAVRVGIGSPCLRTLDPDWIGPASGWCQGFGIDEFMPDGTFTAHNVVMTNRRFSVGGKVYG